MNGHDFAQVLDRKCSITHVQTVVSVGFHQTRRPTLNVDFRHFEVRMEGSTDIALRDPAVNTL